jgi:anti-sigma factor RsiW
MNPTDPPDNDLPCIEVVQLITAYLDGALPPDVRTEVDRHLQGCAGCRTAIAQWRMVIALAGRLTEADVQTTDEFTRDRLLSLCRGLRRR